MPRDYRFKAGDKVRIIAKPSASIECKRHAGEIVTIKARCKFTWAYYLEELPDLWADRCFEKVEVCRFCGDIFTKDDLKELRETGERYHLDGGGFICPDCYDNLRGRPLEEQAEVLLEGASANA